MKSIFAKLFSFEARDAKTDPAKIEPLNEKVSKALLEANDALLKRDLAKAISICNEILRQCPQSDSAHVIRGLARLALAELGGAADDFVRAIELNPQGVEAYINLGNVHKKQGKLDEAMIDWGKAIQLKTTYPEAYYNRGSGHSKMQIGRRQ